MWGSGSSCTPCPTRAQNRVCQSPGMDLTLLCLSFLICKRTEIPAWKERHSSEPRGLRSERRNQHQGGPDVTDSSSGVLWGREPCSKTPLLYHSAKDTLCNISAWTPLGMSCSLPFIALESMQVFPDPEPQSASQSETCPEIQQVPLTPTTQSSFLPTPAPPFSHKLKDPKGKYVYLQNTHTLPPSMQCLGEEGVKASHT